jgi:hypothetical protein
MLVTFIVMMMDDDGAVMMILIVVMMDLDDAVMVLVLVVMMTHHDHMAVMIPVVVSADADGDALPLREHHRPVARCGPGQRRHAQHCKRARDKNQLLHLIFLYCPGVKPGLCIWLRDEQCQTAAACSSPFAKNE